VHEQSAGVLPLGVEPDWVAVHGYKWLLAPRGAAWLHVRPDRVAGTRPLAPNHKGTTSPWTDYYGGPLALAPDARRFDMSLGWPAWAAAGTALDLVASLDPATVEAQCVGLAEAFRTECRLRALCRKAGRRAGRWSAAP
jgi:selenocysteine lyase/cysteine desulfurase